MLNYVGVEPRYMGIGPIAAIPKVLTQVGLTKDDIDVYEVSTSASYVLFILTLFM